MKKGQYFKDYLPINNELYSEVSFNILFAEEVEILYGNEEVKVSISHYHNTKRLPSASFYKKISLQKYE